MTSQSPQRAGRAPFTQDTGQQAPGAPDAPPPVPAAVAPLLMMAFWMLLGGAAGVKFTQGLWHLLGWGAGEVSVAVPVGAGAGAVAGALLGLITRPSLLVLLMAVFAGASAGAVAGGVPWGEVGELGGQAAGAALGAAAWAVWLLLERRKALREGAEGPGGDRPVGEREGEGFAGQG